MAKTQTVCFTVCAEGMNDRIREAWMEKNYSWAVRLCMDGFGLTLEQSFDVISGRKKLASDDGKEFTLESDTLVEYEPDIAPVNFEALMDRMVVLERHAKAYQEIYEFAPLIHAANGVEISRGIRRGQTTHASPIGSVDAYSAIALLARNMPMPDDAQWQAFWRKWEDTFEEDLEDRRNGNFSLSRKLQRVVEGEVEDDDDYVPPTKYPEQAVDKILQNEKKLETNPMAPERTEYSTELQELISKGEFNLDEMNQQMLLESRMRKITSDPMAFIDDMIERGKKSCPDKDTGLVSADGWLLPNGDFYPCSYMEHIWLAARVLERLGVKDADEGNAERDAEKRGWCKISHGIDGKLYIMNQKKHTQKQLTVLFDWCEIHNVDYKKFVGHED